MHFHFSGEERSAEREGGRGGFVHFSRENTCTEIERSIGALTQAQKSRGEYGPINVVRLHLMCTEIEEYGCH